MTKNNVIAEKYGDWFCGKCMGIVEAENHADCTYVAVWIPSLLKYENAKLEAENKVLQCDIEKALQTSRELMIEADELEKHTPCGKLLIRYIDTCEEIEVLEARVKEQDGRIDELTTALKGLYENCTSIPKYLDMADEALKDKQDD